ncbi:MAG: PEP-CTERM sorting domain-containing protein [bacterium]|nr:PEP-CTERM sorting domain-containing protein [bacterium]
MKKLIFALLLLPCFAQAAVILDLDEKFSGDAPKGSEPWISAELTQQGANSILLTLTSGLVNKEFMSLFSLNLAPLLNPDLLSLSWVSGVKADDWDTGANLFKMDGDGYYDLLLSFDTSNKKGSDRFGAGDTSQYLISGISGLSPLDFLYVDNGGKKGDFYAAAHIQGIGRKADDSGWIGADDYEKTSSVPEPSTIFLLGAALLGLSMTYNRGGVRQAV